MDILNISVTSLNPYNRHNFPNPCTILSCILSTTLNLLDWQKKIFLRRLQPFYILDYDYESLDSVKDKAADTLLNNEESDDLDNDDIDEDDPIDEARIGLESSEKDKEEDDFFEEDVVADGKDSAFGNDDGRLPEDESGPSPKGSEPSLQESDPSPQEIDATLDNKDSSKENEDSAADSDEATTTATSETNSERLHSYYVLINFIQREGVEGDDLYLLTFRREATSTHYFVHPSVRLYVISPSDR